MRADVKSELQMLREIVWKHFGCTPEEVKAQAFSIQYWPWKFCYFCKEPLLITPAGMTFGHRRHPKIDVLITQHHEDENRDNNKPDNLRDCHGHCHRSYHAKKRAALRKEVIKQYEQQEKSTRQEEISQRPDEEILTPPGGLHE